MKKLIYILIFLLLNILNIYALIGNQEFTILLFDYYHSDEIALAGNIDIGKTSGVLKNPALLNYLNKIEGNFSYIQWYENIIGNNIIFTYPISEKYGNIGVYFNTLGFSSNDYSFNVNENENLFFEWIFGLSYARKLFNFDKDNSIEGGFTLKFGNSSILNYNASIMVLDLGISYRTKLIGFGDKELLNKNLILCYSLNNLGFTLKPYYNENLHLPIYNNFHIIYNIFKDPRHSIKIYSFLKFQNYEPVVNFSTAVSYSYLETITLYGGYNIFGINFGQTTFGGELNLMITENIGVAFNISGILFHNLGLISSYQINLFYK